MPFLWWIWDKPIQFLPLQEQEAHVIALILLVNLTMDCIPHGPRSEECGPNWKLLKLVSSFVHRGGRRGRGFFLDVCWYGFGVLELVICRFAVGWLLLVVCDQALKVCDYGLVKLACLSIIQPPGWCWRGRTSLRRRRQCGNGILKKLHCVQLCLQNIQYHDFHCFRF